MNTQKSTALRPYKYSSNGIEVFRRNNKDGTFDFAYIVEEFKWVEFAVIGDYTLEPIDQYTRCNLLPIVSPDDSNRITFVVDGDIGTAWAEGGYLDLRFPIKKHQSVFDRIAEQNPDFDWAEILYEMGFEEYDIVYTITFPQREEGK